MEHFRARSALAAFFFTSNHEKLALDGLDTASNTKNALSIKQKYDCDGDKTGPPE